MIKCPNCGKPFEVKGGLLYCVDHGWHKLNDAGEIVPADAPTASEIAAHKVVEAELAAETVEPEKPAEPVEIKPEEKTDTPAQNNTGFLIAAAITGVVAIVILGVAIVKKKKQKDAA